MNQQPPAAHSPPHPPTAPRPIIIGISGGIGSGKSTVAQIFAELGATVFDADEQVRQLLASDHVKDTLTAWWSEDILDSQANLDRAKIAARVFENASDRKKLEHFIHPLVRQARAAALAHAHQSRAPFFVEDIPLLFENSLHTACDVLVFVDVPREQRLARVQTRGWDDAELTRREAAQWPLEEKKRLSHHIIDNSREIAHTTSQVRDLLAKLSSSRGVSPPPGDR